jgi:hypothetical protein
MMTKRRALAMPVMMGGFFSSIGHLLPLSVSRRHADAGWRLGRRFVFYDKWLSKSREIFIRRDHFVDEGGAEGRLIQSMG